MAACPPSRNPSRSIRSSGAANRWSRVGTRVPSTIATESTRRLRTSANANNGPTLSITRCAAACETPNKGPIWRIVRFVRQ
jgi:hypothetical protein